MAETIFQLRTVVHSLCSQVAAAGAVCHPVLRPETLVLWLNGMALHGIPISELRSVTCRMGSQCCLPPDTDEHAPP